MKKKDLFAHLISITLFLMLFVSLKSYAFDYTITFTGSGASTTVESVIVQNLTKGTTVTVPTGNSLNLSDVPNAVEQLNADDETIRVYPNSVEGKFTVSFFAKQAGSTQLNAFSIDGRKVVGINQNLQEGLNSFQLSLPRGAFSIQVVGNGYKYTAKMINQTGTMRKPEITYSGAVKPATSAPQKSKSSTPGTTTMNYATGDQLLYKAVSGNYSTIVTDKPTESKTTNFGFVDCTDADGNNYSVVTIGTQTWMDENLKTTKYNDGTAIPWVSDNTAWGSAWSTPAFCWYGNDATTYENRYGALYNWSAVSTAKLAPTGWHVPTDAEWTTLENYVSANLGTSGSVAKALAATTYWNTNTSDAGAIGNDLTKNNNSGFSALPGGFRGFANGTFYYIGSEGTWWSSTQYSTVDAWSWSMLWTSSSVGSRYDDDKAKGFSVRCVKDDVSTFGIQTVLIPAGTFTMGSPTTEVNRYSVETQYTVTLTAFRMSKYEITNAQYAAFLNAKGIGSNGLYAATQPLIYASSGSYDFGLHFSGTQWIPVTGYETSPVIDVTWYGATEYATYVGGSLPTEAQWEYACRAGTTTPFNTGNYLTNLQANYNWAYPYNGGTNTVTTYPGKTQWVGTYAANAYGLYDMHGNVWEWCSDWYGTYPTSVQTNPTGPATGSYRVVRGGSWYSSAQSCRSAGRNYGYPYNSNEDVGFRVVFVP